VREPAGAKIIPFPKSPVVNHNQACNDFRQEQSD
jgi:hypothetical protein